MVGKHCFVGHVFSREQQDDLRTAIRNAWKDDFGSGFPFYYADQEVQPGMHILEKICRAIDESLLCIFEVSHPSPNVFLELGYALGREKICVFLAKDGCDLPADIRGLDHIPYSSMKNLTAQLEPYLRKVVADAVKDEKPVAITDTRVLVALGKVAVGQQLQESEILQKAHSAGASDQRFHASMASLESLGALDRSPSGWIVTERGARIIGHMQAAIPK